MNSFKQLRDQVVAVWNRSNKTTRAIYAALAAVCLALIAAVGIWSSRPQFVPLAKDLSPVQAAQVVDLLDAERITNKLNFSGSTVLVPKKDFNRARLVVKDLPGLPSPEVDEDPRFPGFVPDPDRSLKRREQQLAQTLMRMNAIKHASVTLGLPDDTPFVREKKLPTAAVIVELHPNVPFSRNIGDSVAWTVTRSVVGLTPENVTVFDTQGRLLSSGTEGSGAVPVQLEIQRGVEAYKTAKADRMLAQVLGEGAAAVSVTAEMDFRQTSRTDTYYDADRGAETKVRRTSNKVGGSPRISQGPPGTSSNVSPSATDSASGPFTQEIEDQETEFQPGMIEETVEEPGGKIRRLSVAATVDLSKSKGVSGQSLTKEDVENIVKAAVGFDANRDDTITVVVGKIAGAAVPVPDPGDAVPWWQKYERLVRSLSLGVAALVAFVIGLLIIRKLRPITVPGGDASEDRRTNLVDELSTKVRENPEAVSRILAAWLNDPGRGSDDADDASDSENSDNLEKARRRAA